MPKTCRGLATYWELAIVLNRTTSASYPNVIMRACGKSLDKGALGQKVPLRCVHERLGRQISCPRSITWGLNIREGS
jgi:hypothetical protein